MSTSPSNNSLPVTFAAPKRILVATDLSDCDYLVPYVVAQAKATNARVTLVHAIVPSSSFPLEAGATSYGDRDMIEGDARKIMLKMIHELEEHGVVCHIDIRRGFASDVVREAILDTGATRVIMGTHGRGKLGQFALGSVANELLKTVDVPVFAVGPGVHGSSHRATPRKILHPVSLVGDFQRGVDFAVELARTLDAELTLMHVMKSDFGKTGSERSLTWAKTALASLVPKGVEMAHPVQFMTSCGKVVDETLAAAVHIDADWIVVGIDADFHLWSVNDSTAYKVLASASCPVMTIRHASRLAAEKEKTRGHHKEEGVPHIVHA